MIEIGCIFILESMMGEQIHLPVPLVYHKDSLTDGFSYFKYRYDYSRQRFIISNYQRM